VRLALALALLCLASTASADPAKLEDNDHALDAWRAALDAQRTGTADHPLRVSYFGDSLTADDHITHALRKHLQDLLGDGGPGFVFAAPPHPYCQHRALSRTVSEGWLVYGVSTFVAPDHLLGLGGSAEADAGGTIKLTPAGAFASIDVHYLSQPGGGKLDVVADGKVLATTDTRTTEKHGAFLATSVPAGTKHVELRARGRVRLFGAALEGKTGAVVDNLGVVNATAKQMRNNNLEDHWRNQLAHRAADLVVIMYGTNEAEWLHAKSAGMAEHEKLFGELLATVRAALPHASCLVVSPLDQLDWHDDKLPPRDSIPAMVEAQRRAAQANGCAFWDTYTWMGGKGSSMSWYKHGWVVKDFQHPTSEGADKIAAALFEGLVSKP
jgi:lysophospholipase L1-like esterase